MFDPQGRVALMLCESLFHLLVEEGVITKAKTMEAIEGVAELMRETAENGAISEVATRRSEFATILRNDGIDGLIAALNRKADILTATTAKAL